MRTSTLPGKSRPAVRHPTTARFGLLFADERGGEAGALEQARRPACAFPVLPLLYSRLRVPRDPYQHADRMGGSTADIDRAFFSTASSFQYRPRAEPMI